MKWDILESRGSVIRDLDIGSDESEPEPEPEYLSVAPEPAPAWTMAFGRYRRKYRRLKRRTRTGKYSRGRRSFQTRVRKVLMKVAETKQVAAGNENVQLYHNTGLGGATYVNPIIFNPWNQIGQGTGRQQRIGLEITPRGMSLRLWIANKLDRPNVMYRVSVCILPKTFNNARVTSGSIDPMVPVFAGGGVGNNIALFYDIEKGIKVLYDRVFSNEKGVSNIQYAAGGLRPAGNLECHIFKKLWIKRKRSSTIKFESNANQDIVNKPLAVYVIPYDSYGTLTSDNIASCGYVYQLYWKDA